MGKGRAPCCDKSKVKRGPWSPEEDLKLINFIHKHGHENWRALPKLAGLVRCGKSCRLRWINYLRPDVKRGNFTKEEEETIIRLHEALGNKWSKIASLLPGRTDNEIKNVWNTHLKKRSKPKSSQSNVADESSITTLSSDSFSSEKTEQDSENQVSNEPINGITEDPKESPASFSSTDHSDLSKPEEHVMDSLFDYLTEDHNHLLEIPMETSDYDIWNILDCPQSFQSNGVQNSNNLRPVISGAEDAEKSNWFHELENELGLGATEEFPKNDDVDMAFFESWSSWPEITGL